MERVEDGENLDETDLKRAEEDEAKGWVVAPSLECIRPLVSTPKLSNLSWKRQNVRQIVVVADITIINFVYWINIILN